MKNINSNLFKIFLPLFFYSFFLNAQNKSGFDLKKHKDTLLNFPAQRSRQIDGRNRIDFRKAVEDKNSASLHQRLSAQRKNQNFVVKELIKNKETGLPVFVSINNSTTARLELRTDKKDACYKFLQEISNITGIKNPEAHFSFKEFLPDALGKTHARFSQNYKGIPVYNSEIVLHLNSSGYGEIFNGNYYMVNGDVDTVAALDKQSAVTIVVNHLKSKTRFRELTEFEKSLLEYKGPVVEKVIYEDNALIRSYILAYTISIQANFKESWEYVINAKTGTILNFYKNGCHVDGPRIATGTDLNGEQRTIHTYQEGETYLLEDVSRPMYSQELKNGLIVTMDAKGTYGNNFIIEKITSADNTWNNPVAVSAHYNAGVAYEYFKNAHNRNSIDGKGGTIYSIINVVDETGEEMGNAYWSTKFIHYGNGDEYFKPLAGGLDVAGHEMTHGVVQNSANLRYQGESGAINESIADIFGFMMDSTDWLIGEDVVRPEKWTSGALRSLEDPHNGGSNLSHLGYQPRHMDEKYTGSADNGGVHINSGIPNWAFYKFATAIGKKNAANVFYRALTIYLTQSSKFIDLRLAVIQSAKDLFGDNSGQAAQAVLAFDAVGIVGETGGEYVHTLPVNPGQEYFMCYNERPNTTPGLMRVATNETTFTTLTGKIVSNKPSVTDAGDKAYFIRNDNTICRINTSPGSPAGITVVENTPVWSNVSVSKDGKKLAAVTIAHDTSIFIFDLVGMEIVQYKIYNPTFTPGVKSGGPVYADALEWDYSGEYLMYDAHNIIKNESGEDIDFWDIYVMKVWDNKTNDFGDGEIFKILPNLGPGESIGNPVFSKNSPEIFAFDYENSIEQIWAIAGCNMEKNEISLIAENNFIGWPCYNKIDEEVIFTTWLSETRPVIVAALLESDKITGIEGLFLVQDYAMWGIYYAVGVRNITGTEDEILAEEKKVFIYPNPASSMINVETVGMSTNLNYEIYSSLGQKMAAGKMEGNKFQLNISEYEAGIYLLKLYSETEMVQYKIVKQ